MKIDRNGRCVPLPEYRVFSQEGKSYYKFPPKKPSVELVYNTYVEIYGQKNLPDLESFITTLQTISDRLERQTEIAAIKHGFACPFIIPKQSIGDLGSYTEDTLVPLLKKSFERYNPGQKFHYSNQMAGRLVNSLDMVAGTGIVELLELIKSNTVVGYYFPELFREYDIDSQRRAAIGFRDVLPNLNTCLGGPIDVGHVAIGNPELLINDVDYPPVLCMSGVQPRDGRYQLFLKAYGKHLQLWCLSEMLTPSIRDVSEQWTAGMSVYEVAK